MRLTVIHSFAPIAIALASLTGCEALGPEEKHEVWVMTRINGTEMCRPDLPGLPVVETCAEFFDLPVLEGGFSDATAGCSGRLFFNGEIGLNNPSDGRFYAQQAFEVTCQERNDRGGGSAYSHSDGVNIEGDCNCGATEITFNAPITAFSDPAGVANGSFRFGQAHRTSSGLVVPLSIHVQVFDRQSTGSMLMILEGALAATVTYQRVTD